MTATEQRLQKEVESTRAALASGSNEQLKQRLEAIERGAERFARGLAEERAQRSSEGNLLRSEVQVIETSLRELSAGKRAPSPTGKKGTAVSPSVIDQVEALRGMVKATHSKVAQLDATVSRDRAAQSGAVSDLRRCFEELSGSLSERISRMEGSSPTSNCSKDPQELKKRAAQLLRRAQEAASEADLFSLGRDRPRRGAGGTSPHETERSSLESPDSPERTASVSGGRRAAAVTAAPAPDEDGESSGSKPRRAVWGKELRHLEDEVRRVAHEVAWSAARREAADEEARKADPEPLRGSPTARSQKSQSPGPTSAPTSPGTSLMLPLPCSAPQAPTSPAIVGRATPTVVQVPVSPGASRRTPSCSTFQGPAVPPFVAAAQSVQFTAAGGGGHSVRAVAANRLASCPVLGGAPHPSSSTSRPSGVRVVSPAMTPGSGCSVEVMVAGRVPSPTRMPTCPSLASSAPSAPALGMQRLSSPLRSGTVEARVAEGNAATGGGDSHHVPPGTAPPHARGASGGRVTARPVEGPQRWGSPLRSCGGPGTVGSPGPGMPPSFSSLAPAPGPAIAAQAGSAAPEAAVSSARRIAACPARVG